MYSFKNMFGILKNVILLTFYFEEFYPLLIKYFLEKNHNQNEDF